MHISKCEFEDCKKKDNCERYVNATGTIIDFKVICFNRGYKHYTPIDEEAEECSKELSEPES